ncbi:hypothetical protein [Oleidesulfovibrio sp.]|uniref:hypothetical protein n=1 Tax=Oleidesulfovibrio sp. TaxID=2909707 RepID=UPI003A897D43
MILAIKLARKEKKEFVVGKDDGRWEIAEISDAASDQLSPSLIVNGNGIKYPDDEYLYSRLIEEGS